MKHHKRGFTLIEMLVVIAVIAVLVSIVIPTVSFATTKAQAAADAANLRIVLGELNIEVVSGLKTPQQIIDKSPNPTSNMDPDAVLMAVYATPSFVDAFYVNGTVCYSLEYLSEMAINGPNSPALAAIGTAKPDIPDGIWYTVDTN